MDDVKLWFNRRSSVWVFIAAVILTIAAYVSGRVAVGVSDPDMYWMIATGRDILDNGILHTNIRTIDETPGFISQQWLYAAICVVLDKIGIWAVFGFCMLQVVVLCGLATYFVYIRTRNILTACVCMTAMIIFPQNYIFSARPETMTLILLLLECIGLEKFQSTKRAMYLALLPASMLVEINVHGSMWIFHYAILLAYLTPAFYCKQAEKNHARTGRKAICVFTVIMTAVMFANPYGVDMILYIFKSFAANTFSYVHISEMAPLNIKSSAFMPFLLAWVWFAVAMHFKKARSVTINLLFGFSLLTLFALRNIQFIPLVVLFFARDLLNLDIHVDDIAIWICRGVNMIGILIATLVVLSAFTRITDYLMIDNISESPAAVPKAIREAADHISNDRDVRLFTGFDTGGYFEYLGYRNIYIDARPELYTDSFTNGKNILADYSTYALGRRTCSDSDMIRWFDEYDFDYLIVNTRTETKLHGFMIQRDDYELIGTSTSKDVVLYGKRGYNGQDSRVDTVL